MELGAAASTSRYGRLLSRGAPAGSLLNGEWLRVDADLVAHPRYVRRDVPELHLFYTGSAWRIVRGSDDPSGELLAEAVSAALHPATVGVSGWSLLEAETGAVRHCPEYEMVCDGPNTELQPFLMEELGRDFFLRVQLTRKVVWFVCPATGNVYHSAAKPGGPGGRSRPGKRYCHLCAKCFSANNFQSQHLANLHRPGRPTALVTVPDEAGGVHAQMTWEVFESKLEAPQMKEFFKGIDVEPAEARRLFELLDLDKYEPGTVFYSSPPRVSRSVSPTAPSPQLQQPPQL